MRLFHRHARRQDVEYHQLPRATPDEEHAWLRDYVVLPGHHDLDVVGETHYQEYLWRAANGQIGSAERVRADVTAVLAAEDDNPYDDNAVSVWVDGRKVGYLPADIALRYRPGLLNAQAAAGKSVALPGVIVGGGLDDAGGQRMLGIFLRHDPADFRLRRPHLVITSDASMGTALSDAMATDGDDDSYDLGWRDRLPGDDIKAIPALRQLLADETEPISRHFMFTELETILYRSRDSFQSALEEYDVACQQHDAEIGPIREALLAKWGNLPLIDTYRQMAIRQQKAGNHQAALSWAERGIAVYGDACGRPEFLEDLQNRSARYRRVLHAR
jgi:hypothetical protein